jgi:O-acetylserine/cysteine efflux transporter
MVLPCFLCQAKENNDNRTRRTTRRDKDIAMKPQDIALAVTVMAIWGFNFVVIKTGLTEVPPLLLTGLRFVFSALPAVFLIPKPDVRWRTLIAFGLVLGVIKFGLLFVALNAGMPAGLSSLILQMQAFFTIGLAILLLNERPNRWQLLGGIVALAGIIIIGMGKSQSTTFLPFLLMLAAAFFWGVANIIAKGASNNGKPVNMLAFIVWASLVPIVPLMGLSLIFEGTPAVMATLSRPTWLSVGAVAYLAYPTTLFGFAVWNSLFSRYATATVAPFSLLVPVFGISSAALVLGEPFAGTALIGGALVFVGLAINIFGPRLRQIRPQP